MKSKIPVMSEIIFLVSPSLEGGYEARALGHSIFTEADSLESLRRQVQDAVACHFGLEHHLTIPDHDSLRIGTLSGILQDVASYLGISKAELIEILFGSG